MIHTCKSLQGLIRIRNSTRGETDVGVGNGAKVFALIVITNHLSLPSRLVLELNNCYYILPLCKTLYLYAQCPSVNGLYVLDLEYKPIYNII